MGKTSRLGLRILCAALCLMSLFTAAIPVFADTEAEVRPQVLTSVVHMRATYSSTVIGQMEDGTALTVLDSYGEFYKIDCYDMDGFIAKSQVEQIEDKYYVNCDPESSQTRSMELYTRTETLELRQSLLALAQDQLGYPYVYGGTRPGGFDCSGLMLYLYSRNGVGLHRSSSQQLQDGMIVAKEGLQVGDLVFFKTTWETYPTSHVGIYAGNNQIIHAGSEGVVYADLDTAYFYDYYLCARRIVNTDAVQAPALPAASVARGIAPVQSISGRLVR